MGRKTTLIYCKEKSAKELKFYVDYVILMGQHSLIFRSIGILSVKTYALIPILRIWNCVATVGNAFFGALSSIARFFYFLK